MEKFDLKLKMAALLFTFTWPLFGHRARWLVHYCKTKYFTLKKIVLIKFKMAAFSANIFTLIFGKPLDG